MNNPLNKWLPTLLCVVLVALSVCGQAQADKFIITGKFRIDGGSNSDAKIVLEKDGKKVRTVDGSSRFEIPLDYQAVYIISFEKEGYVTKRLRFDTHVPPERQEQGFFPFDFTVEIFEQFDDVNMVIFNQPVGKISYDELIDEFNYDTDYTQSIQTQIAQAMEEVEQKKVEKVEKQAEEKKQADALNKQLTSLTTAGDKKVSSGKLDDALKDYQEAVKLKDSPELQKKIADTQAKLEQQKEQQQKKTEFDQLVAEAEAALAGGDLENAKKLFGEANGVLGGDPKVQSQLAKIDQQLAEAQQNAAAFDKLKGEAASALKAGNLQEAIDKSDQALKIKPDAELEGVKTQALAKQEEEKAAVAAQAELDEEYNQLLARATKEADGKDLIAALATLEEAKKLKDTPEVQERIVANQAKLEEVKKAEEALAKAEAATIELLEAAEAALENNDVKLARAKAEEANELKAGVADAVLKQIDEREKIIAAQLAEEQESEEKYNSLIRKEMSS